MANDVATDDEVQAYISGTPAVPEQTPRVEGESASSEEVNQWLDSALKEEKYGTLPEQLKTGLEGAASAATFGLSTGVEKLFGARDKDIQGRRETNPVSHGVGQAVGIAAPALIGDAAGFAGLAQKGMSAAGEGVAAGLGLAGETVASRVAAHGIKAGIEGALFQSGDEVSKFLSNDPAQAEGGVQTALADIGLAGLLGIGIGGSVGAGSELWNATIGKKLGGALEAASHEINSSDVPMRPSSGSILEPSLAPDLAPGVGDGAIPTSKVTAAKEAADRLGIELTPAMASENPVAAPLENNLQKRPTVVGQKLHEQTRDVYDGLNDAAEKTVADHTLKTEAQVGREIKVGLKESLEKELKPIEAEYASLKAELKKTPVTLGDMMQVAERMENQEYVQNFPEMKRVADAYIEKLKNVKNLDELKTLRTFVSDDLEKASRAGGPEARVILEFKNALTDIREIALNNAAERGVAPDTLARLRAADTSYANYKKKLMALGVEGGLGKVNNARALLGKFSKLSDESFATKVFDVGDINQLNYFKENFPEQYELARRYKLKEIRDSSLSQAQGRDGKFDISKFRTQVNKLGPEARQALFQGHEQAIADINTLYQRMSPNFNPTNSGVVSSWTNFLSPKGVVQEMTDAAQYAYLKSLRHLQEAAEHVGGGRAGELAAAKFSSSLGNGVDPGAFGQMAAFIAKTIKGESILNKAAKGIFQAGTLEIPVAINNERAREKLDEKLKALQVNQDGLFKVGDKVAHYLPNHGTAMASTAANAVNYLNSLRPSEEKRSPLDAKPALNQAKKTQFERALDLANNPTLVFKDVKEGTLTSKDIVTVKTLYPALYGRMAEKIHSNLIDAVHKDQDIPYKTKMGLSLFLGQPLDSTMTPLGITSAQPQLAHPQATQQGMPASPGTTKIKALEKSIRSNMTPLQARQAASVKP